MADRYSTTQYLGFGLSGSNSQTFMFQADATIAWVDDNGMAQAQDYYLSNYVQVYNFIWLEVTVMVCCLHIENDREFFLLFYIIVQCRGGSGACPDTVDTTTGRTCTNDVSDVSGTVSEGQQCISFTRPFSPGKLYLNSICMYNCIAIQG